MIGNAKTIADLDTRFQAAVKANDAAAMDEILHPDMILVVGRGTVFTKKQLIDEALAKSNVYERQDEESGTQTVRMFGPDVGIVTAKLWIKGRNGNASFDRKLWFSDTYVRTQSGWKYAFGQSSIALPES